MGTFDDRSVVTERRRAAFEFVTEARLYHEEGHDQRLDVHRSVRAHAHVEGCRIVSTGRFTRMSELPGMLALFNVRGLRGLG